MDELNLDGLTHEQRQIISKHVDYYMYLAYLKDDFPLSSKDIEEYQCWVLAQISNIGAWKKRAELVGAGVLKGV